MKGLFIFIKNPELGRCKTRLAATIGNNAALKVYINLLDHTRSAALEADCKKYVFYDKNVIKNDKWDLGFEKRLQADGDLGARIKDGFKKVLELNQKAVIIGSDCPEISSDIINKAFLLLEQYDCVIGPTIDGGYYLLGLKENNNDLFENINWSTPSVYEETIQKMKNNNLSFSELPKLTDIDTEDDLKRFPSFKL